MKISNVTATLFNWATMPPISYQGIIRTGKEAHDQGLVTIHTDAGIEGHAFLGKGLDGASSDAGLLVKYLKPLLIGQDPLDRERLSRAITRRNRISGGRTIGAVDTALWDLGGKIAGMPVRRMLGSYRDSIQAYVSSDHLPTPQHCAEGAVQYKELGYVAYKIHPPSDWRAGIRVCEAVRKAVGDDYLLMLDSTHSYLFEEALQVGRAIKQMGFYWFEDPSGENDLYNYVKLKQKLDIPLMATERPAAGFDSYAIWITERATDYLRGDVAIKGGLSTMIKTAHLAEAFGMRYEVHAGGNSPNNLANLHIEMAIANTQFHEIFLPRGAADYGLLNEIEVMDGWIAAPTGPGLVAVIDFDLIERKKLAVLQ